MWSAWWRSKPGSCSALFTMDSLSQVSGMHKAAEREKSEFILLMSSSSSILLGRKWKFTRWMNGSDVPNLHCLYFTSALVRFPCLPLLQAPYRADASLAKISTKRPAFVNVCKILSGIDCQMVSSLLPVKIILFSVTKHRTNKNKEMTRELRTVATIPGAMTLLWLCVKITQHSWMVNQLREQHSTTCQHSVIIKFINNKYATNNFISLFFFY